MRVPGREGWVVADERSFHTQPKAGVVGGQRGTAVADVSERRWVRDKRG